MTHVVSFIKLKGGVAKTTTLVQLAETLAFMRGKQVLVWGSRSRPAPALP